MKKDNCPIVQSISLATLHCSTLLWTIWLLSTVEEEYLLDWNKPIYLSWVGALILRQYCSCNEITDRLARNQQQRALAIGYYSPAGAVAHYPLRIPGLHAVIQRIVSSYSRAYVRYSAKLSVIYLSTCLISRYTNWCYRDGTQRLTRFPKHHYHGLFVSAHLHPRFRRFAFVSVCFTLTLDLCEIICTFTSWKVKIEWIKYWVELGVKRFKTYSFYSTYDNYYRWTFMLQTRRFSGPKKSI